MKIVITQEDVINNPKFTLCTECPMARKMQNLLNNPNIMTFGNHIMDSRTKKLLGKLDERFAARDFKMLKEGTIKEFVTEYTPL